MGLLDSLGSQMASTFNSLREKNHRSAVINRLHIVIQNERENSARAYVALGKYFYEHLRDQGNAETDALCACIDDSDRRMKRAFDHMDEIRESNFASVDETECTDCKDDCGTCKFYEDNDDEQDAESSDKDKKSAPPVQQPSTEQPQQKPASSAQPAPAVTPADEEAAPEEPET
jgi:hypothetical protein